MDARRLLIVVGALAACAPLGSARGAVIDSGGVGQFASIALGSDGRGLISYYDGTNGDLKVAHCDDAACTTATLHTLDSAGDTGRDTSLTIGSDGLGFISYRAGSQLKVAHCNDVACTGATVTTLTVAGAVEGDTAVAISGGRPVIAYRAAGQLLRTAYCQDAVCTAATSPAAPLIGSVQDVAITIVGDGRALVAVGGAGQARVGHCQDDACTVVPFAAVGLADGRATNGPPPPPLITTREPTLATDPSGKGFIVLVSSTVFQTETTHRVEGYRCLDVACTNMATAVVLPISVDGPIPATPATTVLTGNRPVWTYDRQPGPLANTLVRWHCTTSACAQWDGPVTVDGPGAGATPSMVSDGSLVLIAYHGNATGTLRVASADLGPPPPDVVDLVATITGTPDPVGPGEPFQYDVLVGNQGPATAHGVSIQVQLPAGLALTVVPANCAYAGAQGVPQTLTCPRPDVNPGTSVALLIGGRMQPGFPGPLAASVTATTTSVDTNPADNVASESTATRPSLRVTAPEPFEGNAGVVDALFRVDLLDDGSHGGAVASYQTGAGSATPGVDYLPASGTLTFSVSSPTQTVTVGIVGDTAWEPNETFALQMPNPQGAVVLAEGSYATIVDDDVNSTAIVGELHHGVTVEAVLRSDGSPGPPTHDYRFLSMDRSSYEVFADGVSGDLQPLQLAVVAGDGGALASAQGAGEGASPSVRFLSLAPLANYLVRVRSGGCATDCGADDVYRLSFRETTQYAPRFNNGSTQKTLVILQNTSDEVGTVILDLRDPAGHVIGSQNANVPPHGSVVIDTAPLAPGQSGSLSVANFLPYGALVGKAVSLEPATGFSFDTPLEYRQR